VDTFTHEVNVKTSRMKIQIFFMGGFYFEILICTNRERRELPLCSLRSIRSMCLWFGKH
jgi:hypothetical protein